MIVAGLVAMAGCGGEADDRDSARSESAESVITATGTDATATTIGTTATTAASSTGSTLSITAPSTSLQSGTSATSPTTSTVPESSTQPSATSGSTGSGSTGSGSAGAAPSEEPGSPQRVPIRFESQVDDVPVDRLRAEALAILNDPRGWVQAGFTFVADDAAPYRLVLAEGDVVDQLCLPLRTYGSVSCQNGPVVALNADRWRSAVDHWVLGVEVYRGYLVNHEVGHLIGQRHPKPRCPVPGRPAGVMEQQTAGLEGCIGNPWPRQWELDYAGRRPVVYAPLPDWAPDPVPTNSES